MGWNDSSGDGRRFEERGVTWNRNESYAASEGRRQDEPLNSSFADILDNALAAGPEFAIYLLDLDDVSLGSETELRLCTTGKDPNPTGTTEARSHLALVRVGDSCLLGIESSRNGAIEASELRAKAEKIEELAREDHESVLFVLTYDYSEPETIETIAEETTVSIEWRSWFDVIQRAKNPPTNMEEQWAPVLRDLNKFFDAFGFKQFTTIKQDERFLQSVDDLQTRVGVELDRYSPGRQFPNELRGNQQNSRWGLFLGHHPVTVYWKVFAFNDQRSSDLDPEMTPLFAGLLARDYAFEVYSCVLVQPGQHAPIANHLNENAEEIAEIASDEGMTVLEFPLNWFSNPYSDDPERRGKQARSLTEEDEIWEMLHDRVSDRPSRFTARRVAFGFPVHDAEDPPTATISALKTLEDVFNYDEERQRWGDTLI